MKKRFITGVGGMVLAGLLVTQSWAGSFKSDLSCPFPIKKGDVSINAKGDVKGSIKLTSPAVGNATVACEIFCGPTQSAGPATCINVEDGDTTVKIKAPGLGAALPGTCEVPSVLVGPCVSAYIPPAP